VIECSDGLHPEAASDLGSVTYQLESPPFDRELVTGVVALAGDLFGGVDGSKFEWRLANLPDPTLCVASESDALVIARVYEAAPRWTR